ncbi:MAG: hypothetical protein HOK85_07810, partial [Euryarchaeota archaeon]|nr:hypothetical protein [Euryarchaeota archaeon]
LFQLNFGYNLTHAITKTTTVFEIEGFYSPGKWLSDQSNNKYNNLRTHAKNQYFYVKSYLSNYFEMPYRFAWRNSLRGQISTNNLLPSEEVGLGGMDTIRGYKERELNFDNAIIFNSEFYLPYFSLAKIFKKSQAPIDKFQVFGFFDFGLGGVNKTIPNQSKSKILYSVGPGVRYKIDRFLTCKVDWGFQLNSLKASGLGGPSNRLSFSLIAGF